MRDFSEAYQIAKELEKTIYYVKKQIQEDYSLSEAEMEKIFFSVVANLYKSNPKTKKGFITIPRLRE